MVLRIIQVTGFRSLANASQASRSASNGIEPPPAKGSTTSGAYSVCAAFTNPRPASRNVALEEWSQFEKSPMKCSRASLRSLSVAPTRPGTGRKTSRDFALKSSGQCGSQGSGARVRAASRETRPAAAVPTTGAKSRDDRGGSISPAPRASDTTAIGKSTSARRLHSRGINGSACKAFAESGRSARSAGSRRLPTDSSGPPA